MRLEAGVFLGFVLVAGCSRPWQGPEWDRIDATTRMDSASGAALAGVPDPRVPSTAGVRGEQPIEILPIEIEPDTIESRRPVVVTVGTPTTAAPVPIQAQPGLAPSASSPGTATPPSVGSSPSPASKTSSGTLASSVEPPLTSSGGVAPFDAQVPPEANSANPGQEETLAKNAVQADAAGERAGSNVGRQPASKTKGGKSKAGKKSAQGRVKNSKKGASQKSGKKKSGQGKTQVSASGAPNLAEKLAKHVRIGLTASGGRGSRRSGSSSGLKVKPRISITL